MHGTWQTTSGHPALRLAVLAVLAAVLLGSGAAAAVSAVIWTVVIIAGTLLALATIGLAALVVYRIRREHQAAPPVLLRQLDAGAPRELGASGPRELHQHWHFHGADSVSAAEILRRAQRPEQ
jgi:hypothetical protein